jgi:hypothetical protein
VIRLDVPWVPPSSNKAYFNKRGGGGRMLSTEGRKFKTATTTHFAQKYPAQMMFFKPNLPYLIVMRFYFDDVETKGFATGKAEARYKVFDGGNRTKLLEDCLKDAGGIDDSQTLISIWQKEKSSPERTTIWAWSLEEEACELYELVRSLA